MLDEATKAQLKQAYGKLYITELDNGQEVVWHPLNRKEYRDIISDFNADKTDAEIVMNRQEDTCRKCIVYPSGADLEDLIQEYAGVVITICDEIYAKSGFNMTKSTREL